MSRKSTASRALARSYGTERTLTFLVGLLALLTGVAVLVVGLGWLGAFRARRPLLDPLAVDWLSREPTIARIVAIVVGVLLFVLGLWWFVRSLRPERKPDLELDHEDGEELVVTSSAISDAVQTDAESVDGVSKARARVVGEPAVPALRLSLWLREGAELKAVWEEIDGRVLARAREALGVATLPTAVRVELDAGQRRRVR
jgi:hypothetical protein